MMSLRKIRMVWPGLLALAAPGLLPAGLPAQVPDQSQSTTSATFTELQHAAASEAETGDAAKAIRDTRRALEIQPDWKEGWWNLGSLEYETNDYADAADALQKVVAYAPQLGTAWALLGLCEFELKQYSPSLSHLEKAQTLGLGDDCAAPDSRRSL
jgi:tetratricopeptide (TPR) repeat protein